METWLTYSPRDFLLFSERVYWRLFELNNADLWPAQIPALIGGLAVAGLLIARPVWAGRAAALILATAWLVSALTFMPRYAEINWLAGDLIPVFVAHAVLLALLGLGAHSLEPSPARGARWIGIGLCVYGLAAPPLAALLTGRGLMGAEIFALTPDPTAIVTLGALLAARPSWTVGILAVVPVLWCLASWATLATLGEAHAWLFAPVVLAVIAAAWTAHVSSARERYRGEV